MRSRRGLGHLAAAWRDPLRGLEASLGDRLAALGRVFAGLAAGWWIYVPLHELLHAFGCLLAGGTVSRLEIDALYGGRLLARLLPFVTPASEYAGRLSGFDTGGSDLVYLATDLAPFALALWPGLWLLRRAARAARPLVFGFSLPWALAPILSLSGDAYEIGSLLVRQLPAWSAEPLRTLLVGDDVVLKARELAALADPPWGGFAAASLLGLFWAWGTVAVGSWVAARLGQPPLPPPAPRRPGPAADGIAPLD